MKAVVVTQFEMQELSQSVEVEYYDPPKAVHLGPLRSTFKPKSRSVKFGELFPHSFVTNVAVLTYHRSASSYFPSGRRGKSSLYDVT